MAETLDPRFYTCVHSNKCEDPLDKNYEITYSGYVPKFGHPMALFSKKDGMPLAILELRYQNLEDYAGGSDTFITELPSDVTGKQLFQGVVTKDNVKIEFVITNLSDDYVNFNLMKCDKKVEEVNPKGLNEINELRAYESYAILSDQTLGNKVIMIKAHELEKSAKSDRSVKLKDEMSNDNQNKVGTYLFLSVVPHYGNKELADRFEATFWKPINSFVVKGRKQKRQKPRHFLYAMGGMREEGHFRGYNYGGGLEGARRRLRTQSHVKDYSYFEEDHTDGSFNRDNMILQSGTVSVDEITRQLIDPRMGTTDSSIDKMMTEDTLVDMRKQSERLDINSEKLDTNSLVEDVMDSKVGNIVVGDDTVSVTSQHTDISYDFDRHSMPCVLGVSVMEGFKLKKCLSTTELENEIKQLIQSYVENTFQNLISQMQVYAESNCCVCLNENPDTVFFRCGHKCTDYVCAIQVETCPLCRSVVAAVLNDKHKTLPTNNNNNFSQNLTTVH